MNVISWNAWSRTTTTHTDPGNIPTGTWLWREQASINRVQRPARVRRPSCFCPCQPSADGEMLSNLKGDRQTTDADALLTNPTPRHRWAHPDGCRFFTLSGKNASLQHFYLGTLPKQMYLESITAFICSCSVTLEISAISSEEPLRFCQFRQARSSQRHGPKSHRYALRSNFPKYTIIPLDSLKQGSRVGLKSSPICTIRSWIRDCVSRRNVFSTATKCEFTLMLLLYVKRLYMQVFLYCILDDEGFCKHFNEGIPSTPWMFFIILYSLYYIYRLSWEK